LGLRLDLGQVPAPSSLRDDRLMYSESQGRLLVSVDPARRAEFEAIMGDTTMACVGEVLANRQFTITGRTGKAVLDSDVDLMLQHYRSRFRRFSSTADIGKCSSSGGN
jgi:phosphoribosylformylglycinamidine synthase